MSRKAFSFALGGGLDEVAQPLAIAPGRAIACANHEAIDSGYGRVAGFERFDGRVGPTAFPFYLLDYTNGTAPFEAGDIVTGADSGATGTVLVDATAETGVVGLRSITGAFEFDENLTVGGQPRASALGAQVAGVAGSGSDTEEAIALAARDYARALISAVPGSGPVRGVWEFEGTVYAFRDNVGATAGAMFKSTTAGWVAISLGHTLDFTSGGSTEIFEGDTITGATSAATATIARVIVQSGDWAAGDAAGYLVLAGITGTFQAENLNVGASTNLATIAGVPVATSLPTGGRYFFHTHNFYGASNLRRVYGCNGVGTAFEFDDAVFVPIRTGMPVDTPTRVAVFRNHLFLAFPGGSVQHSGTAEPVSWEAITGAAEIAIGSDVADFIITVDALILLGEHGIYSLLGYDATDWQLSPITLEAGALPFTAQRFGPGIYLDNRGLRSISATQAYGNFAMGTFTQAVQKTLKRKVQAGARPIASAIIRQKNHYRLFFDDGSGLSFYMGRKFPEPMYFELSKVPRCISANESQDDAERVFFGSDDGFVYLHETGTSYDGEAIEAFLQLPYANMGSPTVLKRVFKTSLEMVATSGTELGVTVEFDYSNNEQADASHSAVEAVGAGGLWGVGNWGEFYWSSPVENVLEADVDGQGRNASLIIYSNSAAIAPYELRGATYFYGERGAIR
jgi:hypothetical protein